MEVLLKAEQVINLIPQKEPFVMIDEMVGYNDKSTTSNLTITEENIFCVDGYFEEPGLIENIAQTAAVRAGYLFSKLKEENPELEPPVGFIGAIKNLKISKLPKIGDKILTTISIENQVFDITMVDGKVVLNDEVIASCSMKIFVQDSSKMPA